MARWTLKLTFTRGDRFGGISVTSQTWFFFLLSGFCFVMGLTHEMFCWSTFFIVILEREEREKKWNSVVWSEGLRFSFLVCLGFLAGYIRAGVVGGF